MLGDAAHPMLPTLGQGACQAIEDAAALVRHLDSDTDVETALRAYERRRERRVAPFVYGSRRSATARSIVSARTRDVLLRTTPRGCSPSCSAGSSVRRRRGASVRSES